MRAPVAAMGWPREMPEPFDVQVILVGQLPLAKDSQHLGGEGLVELDEIHVLEGTGRSCS